MAALSRLFGKSNKKSVPSSSPTADRSPAPAGPAGPAGTAEISEDEEGFTVVGSGGDRSSSQVYPPLPGQAAQQPYPSGTLHSQSSVTGGGHALDGVPFVLSPKCASALAAEKGASGRAAADDDDAEVRRVQAQLDSVSQLLASANYDFRQEKNVVDQEITETMRRLHT